MITFSFDVGLLVSMKFKERCSKVIFLQQLIFRVGHIALQKIVPRTYRIFCHPGPNNLLCTKALAGTKASRTLYRSSVSTLLKMNTALIPPSVPNYSRSRLRRFWDRISASGASFVNVNLKNDHRSTTVTFQQVTISKATLRLGQVDQLFVVS